MRSEAGIARPIISLRISAGRVKRVDGISVLELSRGIIEDLQTSGLDLRVRSDLKVCRVRYTSQGGWFDR